MYCPKCGTQNPDGSRFCKSCGASLERQGIVPAAPPQVVGAASSPAGPQPWWRRGMAPIAVVAALVVVLVLVFRVIGVSVGGGASSKGGVAVMGGTQVGPVTFGGVQMGNTASNYATYGIGVSDGTYDYFFSSTRQGICRARKDGSSVDVILSEPEGWIGSIGDFSLDGGRLFYVQSSLASDSSAVTYTVHSMATDGSDDRIVYTVSSAGSSAFLGPVYLYDHVLYVVRSEYDDSRTTHEVWTMNEDGSNQQKVGGYDSDGASSAFVTKDSIYFTYTPNSSGDGTSMGAVYSQNLDGTNFKQLYSSEVGSIYSTPFLEGGRLYFMESNSSVDRTVLTSITLDGSDPQSLYSASTKDTTISLTGVMHGSAYLATWDSNYSLSVTMQPLSGGDTTTFTPSDGMFLSLVDCGDHMLVVASGDDVGSAGLAVAGYDFAGNKLHDYVTSS